MDYDNDCQQLQLPCQKIKTVTLTTSDKDAEKEKPVDKIKTLLALSLLFAAWLSNDVALAWIHERVPYESEPLPDIWFTIFSEYQPAIKITEFLIIISVTGTLVVIAFHRHRWIVARRSFIVAALCYFGRAVCITVTQVPVPSRNTYCSPRANVTGVALVAARVARTFSGLGMDFYRPRELCGDLVYSGHTTVLVLCYCIVARYCPDNCRKFAAVFCGFGAAMGAVCILVARKHYTLDVILAVWITARVFDAYHARLDAGRRKSPPRGENAATLVDIDFYRRKMADYLEGDEPRDFGNAFHWPPFCRRVEALLAARFRKSSSSPVVVENCAILA